MSSTPDKLTPNDPRVEHHTLTIRNNKWHYLLANPSSSPSTATMLLVHGWPDLAFGWRYQVPHLLSLGLRVIIPDMLGYGGTDAPALEREYSMKNIANDLATLAAHVVGEGERVVLGGHDWGGAVVWKMALWRPEVVSAVFSVCTPYAPPREGPYVDLEGVVKRLPNFRYQLQLAGREVEEGVVGEERTRGFLCGMYGGRTRDGERAFDTQKGVFLEKLEGMGMSPLLNEEEVEFYVREYVRKGLHGPLNWYRTTRVNWEEERELVERGTEALRIKVPSMIVTASKDDALPPAMTAYMGPWFDSLERREVEAGHWALWQAAADVNRHIGDFLSKVLGTEQGSKL
ncbi:epoxide hydrolase [Cercophora newfieldiana]|uniref:Epoxide hydrolase n=1 Tax=Cercophora newfieldiana TaxID=92897 RepID=A0AA39Y5K2_9PEZI|nr:epoxide hydrolase [Cercophora newfieldiana]